MKIIKLILFLVLSLNALELQQKLPEIEIGSWNSHSLEGRVVALFYIDPDEKDMNSKFSALVEKKGYDKSIFVKVAIINLNATWKPNFVIEKLLASHQKDFPDTIYLKDKKSLLVEKWGLKDNSADVLIFSKEGKLLFYKDEAMSTTDIQKALKIIETHL